MQLIHVVDGGYHGASMEHRRDRRCCDGAFAAPRNVLLWSIAGGVCASIDLQWSIRELQCNVGGAATHGSRRRRSCNAMRCGALTCRRRRSCNAMRYGARTCRRLRSCNAMRCGAQTCSSSRQQKLQWNGVFFAAAEMTCSSRRSSLLQGDHDTWPVRQAVARDRRATSDELVLRWRDDGSNFCWVADVVWLSNQMVVKRLIQRRARRFIIGSCYPDDA
uniref:Uncharacterized protein n=1 Tax=Aegilops tauschii subsp. strangulata TaxID=200361 RepID=A0A453F2T9_AEGTS